MSVLTEFQAQLQKRSDVFPNIHLHPHYVDFMGAVFVQDIFLCIARKETTYNLKVMRQFRDSFSGFKINDDFEKHGSLLKYGTLSSSEMTSASFADLEAAGMEMRGAHGLDETRQYDYLQRFYIRILPCWRLLNRHALGNYQPLGWTSKRLDDRFIVKFLVH